MGTSFSARLCREGVLLHSLTAALNQSVRWRVRHAVPLTGRWLGYGRLIFVRLSRQCLRRVFTDFSVSAAHPGTITGGQQTTFNGLRYAAA